MSRLRQRESRPLAQQPASQEASDSTKSLSLRPLSSYADPTAVSETKGRGSRPMLAAIQDELDFGLEAAIDNADDWWSDCAWRGLKWMAELRQPFDAWDLVQLGVPDPDDPHRWGGLFRRAARAKIIRAIGYAPSRRPTAAGSIARIWQGT